jgi:tetratricopeptide (TPR) repeat protein
VQALEATADALEQVARVDFEGGDLPGARQQLEGALAKAPQSAAAYNNLGVVLAAMDSLTAADEHWRAALALGSRDPGIRLNRGLARWAAGDSLSALPILATAVADAGGYAAACRLIDLPAEEPSDHSSDAPEILTLRARLRNLLKQSAAGSGKLPPSARARDAETALPSPLVRGIGSHLYWIE